MYVWFILYIVSVRFLFCFYRWSTFSIVCLVGLYIVSLVSPLYIWAVSCGQLGVYAFNSNYLSSVLWFSGIVLTVLFFWYISQRTTINKYVTWLFSVFVVLVYLYLTTNNYLVLFMCYELFVLPSFLLVLYFSPNSRGVIASIYFLIWTQVGSVLVFLGVIILYSINSSFYLSDCHGCIWSFILFFIGFGVNVPIWPAHYWLTKTHVEAPTYFSIYLSGFLVKTALYGLWFFSNIFSSVNLLIVLVVAFIGVIDSSLNMWGQSDLNNLVAYGTIQEMNMILIGLAVMTDQTVIPVLLFILAHTILSTMFFLIVDSIYKRFGARTTYNVYALWQDAPTLATTIFACCILFMGLPFTLNFLVEVFIFLQVSAISVYISLFIIFLINVVGVVGFMYHWFHCLFGNSGSRSIADISHRELATYSFLMLWLVMLVFVSILI